MTTKWYANSGHTWKGSKSPINVLTDSQVHVLVSAMADFAPPAAGRIFCQSVMQNCLIRPLLFIGDNLKSLLWMA